MCEDIWQPREGWTGWRLGRGTGNGRGGEGLNCPVVSTEDRDNKQGHFSSGLLQ